MKFRLMALLVLAAGCVHGAPTELQVEQALPPAPPPPGASAWPSPASPQPVSRQPTLPAPGPPRDRPAPIVALGDSITFGVGDDNAPDCGSTVERNGSGYPARLAIMERVPVINAGICGDTSFGGRKRVLPLLERYRPALLLILFSPNDVRGDIDEVTENLRFMIRAARSRAATPVLGTLTPAEGRHAAWQPFISALNQRIRRLATEERVSLADHERDFSIDRRSSEHPDELLGPDGLHPNRRGYDLMALTWGRALRSAAARRTPGGPRRP